MAFKDYNTCSTYFVCMNAGLSTYDCVLFNFQNGLLISLSQNKLNCPVCTSRKKDTVLTKCFHVFCAECIKTRYETRQRKCPKCNAAFGANDFHKIYLS